MDSFDFGLLIPIGVCVVLPIMIVWIVFKAKTNNDNKRADVLIKAIENNANIDAEKLAEALGKQQISAKELLNRRLLRGCMFTILGVAFSIIALTFSAAPEDMQFISYILAALSFAVGIAYLIVYFVTRNTTAETEENE
ncbi:MAG: DUF6249 domain-containing protein [Muribaculaceae bacterium]|jgi:hypothetical protein|nr:DUF6249 domain-containing protein [Muribaculaceae bacterium]